MLSLNWVGMASDRIGARFLGANADNLINVINRNFTVANFTGPAGADDGIDDLFDHFVIGEDIQLQPGDVITVEGAPPVGDRLSFLQPEAFDVLQCEKANAYSCKGVTHFLKAGQANNSLYLLHFLLTFVGG